MQAIDWIIPAIVAITSFGGASITVAWLYILDLQRRLHRVEKLMNVVEDIILK